MTQKSQTTKKTTVITMRIKNEALALLNQLSAENDITRNDILLNALRMYGNWCEQVIVNPPFQEHFFEEELSEEQKATLARFSALKEL